MTGQAEAQAGPPARQRLIDRWYRVRDRLLRDRRFQLWAARFPLTRPIARRRQADLFDLVAGFVYTQTLKACVDLDVFILVADEPMNAREIARRCRVPLDAMTRLLDAAVSLRLLNRRGPDQDLYGLGDLGAALIGNPGVVAMIRHHALLYGDLADPVALLRGEIAEPALSRYWTYATSDDPKALKSEEVGDYSALMAASQAFIAAEILSAYSLARHKVLLDIGGGQGAFIKEAAKKAPHLRFKLFDLPAVAERARRQVDAAGIGTRVETFGGDLFADPLPTGADIATLIRVLYDHPTHRALDILRRAHAALAPGATLIVAEPMAGTRGAEAMGSAYFGFYLLAMKGGAPRTVRDLSAMIREAGFTSVRQRAASSPLLTSVLAARR